MEAIVLFLTTGIIGTIVFLWLQHDYKKPRMSEKHNVSSSSK